MVSEAKLQAQYRYDKKNTRQIILKLNNKTDADIISKLEDVENKQGYIKDLVRSDLRSSGDVLELNSIKYLIQPVAKKYDVEQICIIGSYARNEATSDSDVDLVIRGGNYKGLLEYMAIKDAFEEVLGKGVDLLSEKAINENTSASGIRFKNKIEKDKLVIYEKNQGD